MHIPIELSKVLKNWSNKNGLKIARTNSGKRLLKNVMKWHELWGERILPFKMEVNVLQKDLGRRKNGEGTTRHMAFQINVKTMEKVAQWQIKFMEG